MKASTLVVTLLLTTFAHCKLSFNCNTTPGDFEELTYKKGDKVIVCVHFLPYGVKVAFEIEVDAFVTLSLRRAYDALNKYDTDFFLQLENTEDFTNLNVSLAALHQKGEEEVLHCPLDHHNPR